MAGGSDKYDNDLGFDHSSTHQERTRDILNETLQKTNLNKRRKII